MQAYDILAVIKFHTISVFDSTSYTPMYNSIKKKMQWPANELSIVVEWLICGYFMKGVVHIV